MKFDGEFQVVSPIKQKSMTIFERIKGLFQKTREKSYNLWRNIFTGESLSIPSQKTSNQELLDAYSASFLVNACVKKIADKTATIQFKLYELKIRRGEREIEEVKEHRILDLLENPNPLFTKYEVIKTLSIYYDLLGNAYLLKIRNERGLPIELWTLRPDWMMIKINEEGTDISHYEYRLPNGKIIPYEKQDIIHFHEIDPQNQLSGVSPVSSAIGIIKSSVFAQQWNLKTFANSAIPDALLMVKGGMTNEMRAELERNWNERFRGADNAHKIGVLEGEMEYLALNRTMRDMEYAKLSEISRDDIMAALGVPRVLLYGKDMNKATGETLYQVFLSEKIKPRMNEITEKLDRNLSEEFGENLYLDFIDPSPKDRTAILREHEASLNKWKTINEIREEEGLEPIDNGWELLLPMGLEPLGNKLVVDEEKHYQKKKEIEKREIIEKAFKVRRKYKIKEEIKSLVQENTKTIQDIKAIIKGGGDEKDKDEYERQLTADEQLFRSHIRAEIKKQKQRILEIFNETYLLVLKEAPKKEKLTIEDLRKYEDKIDWEVEKRTILGTMKPVYTDIINRKGKNVLRATGEVYNNHTARAIRAIDRCGLNMVKHINRTTRRQIIGIGREVVKEGLGQGEGIVKIGKKLEEVFKDRRAWQTKRISQTEVQRATGRATQEAYYQSKVVEKKQWLTAKDERVREEHARLDGEIVKKGQRFSNGEMYPGEKSINCRCSMRAIIKK